MNNRKRVTIKEVAEYAGVSIGAVSKVLHGRGGTIRVSEARAEQIRHAAQVLHYRANHHARSLRSGETKTLALAGMARAELTEPGAYHSYILDRLTVEAFRHGYQLIVSNDAIFDETFEESRLTQVDGILWTNGLSAKIVQSSMENLLLPHVVVNPGETLVVENVVSVNADTGRGAELALDHLHQLGHRKIDFVVYPHWSKKDAFLTRYQYFLDRAEARCLSLNYAVVEPAEYADHWKQSKDRATAVIGWNDRVAFEVIRGAYNFGVSVPADLSVVGFDSTPFASWLTPGLTSIKNPIETICRIALEEMLRMIKSNDRTTKVITVPTALDIRGTTDRVTTS